MLNTDRILAEHRDNQEIDFCNIINIDDVDDNYNPIILKPSPYYTTEELSKFKNLKNNFTIMSWNCNRLLDKHTFLESQLDAFHTNNFTPDVILIQESKLIKETENLVKLDNYTETGFRHISQNQAGICIYVKNDLEFEEINSIPQPPQGQIYQWVFGKVYHKENPHNFKIIGNIYRSGNSDLQSFMIEFPKVIQKLNAYKNEIFIGGDFNFDLLEIENDDVSLEFFDLLMNNSFLPTITMPTRFPTQNNAWSETLYQGFFTR